MLKRYAVTFPEGGCAQNTGTEKTSASAKDKSQQPTQKGLHSWDFLILHCDLLYQLHFV